MLLSRLRIKKDIIDKHHCKLVQVLLENHVHQMYKCSQSIGQPKLHDKELVVLISCTKGCLTHIFLSHYYW